MWLKHPRTGQKDTMLSLALYGFLFTLTFSTTAIILAWITKDPNYLNNVAMIDAAVLSPTAAAYTIRKYSEFKNSKNERNKE